MKNPHNLSAYQLQQLTTLSTEMVGINFALTMQQKGRRVTLKRQNQPCYGELRKYKKSHGEEYTNPLPEDDYRPSDLHHPFPSGTPLALATSFRYMRQGWSGHVGEKVFFDCVKAREEILDFVFSDQSPWRVGLGTGDIILTQTKETFGVTEEDVRHSSSPWTASKKSVEVSQTTGLVLTRLDLDPTVLVNLLNNLRSLIGSTPQLEFYSDLRGSGASIEEAILICTTVSREHFSSGPEYRPNSRIGYYSPRWWNFKAFFERTPRDLTGGTLEDRFDYNRKLLHSVFEDEESTQDSDAYSLVAETPELILENLRVKLQRQEVLAA